MKKERKVLRSIAYNALVVAAFFILLELILRIFFPYIQSQGTDPALLESDVYFNSQGLKKNISGTVFGRKMQTDSNRCRKNGKINEAKKRTWLHLGDSVTMGVGVEDQETFSSITAAHNDSLNIMNPSVIGFSTDDYLNVIKTLLVKEHNRFSIKYVSLFFCLNDVYHGDVNNDLKKTKSGSFFLKLTGWLKSNYRTYILLKNLATDRSRVYFEHDSAFYNETSPQLASSCNDLNQIDSICKVNGVHLQVEVLPYKYELRAGVKFSAAHSLSAHCPSIKIIDVAGEWRKKNEAKESTFEPDKCYLYGDGIHFNAHGHSCVYELLKAQQLPTDF